MVANLKYKFFVADYEDIVFDNVTTNVSLRISVGQKLLLDEIYHPNSEKKVIISGIGDVLSQYFTFDSTQLFAQKNKDRSLIFEIRSTVDGVVNYNTQILYYSSVLLGVDLYDKFLTRYQTKKTNIKRQEILSIYDFTADFIEVGVAYIKDGIPRYYRAEFSQTLYCCTINVSLSVLPDWIDAETGYHIDANDIIYYDVYALTNESENQVVDKIQYINDKREYPHEVRLVYNNCFGVPETIAFTGITKSATALNAQFAQIKHSYSKIFTDPVATHQLYTGPLDQSGIESIEDIIRSDQVWIYQDPTTLIPITITDINMESNNRGNEPKGYSISYRLSDNRQRFKKVDKLYNRSFDKTFDQTFD